MVTIKASSGGHSLILTSKGNLYGCGNNEYGQLGVGDFTHRHTPTKINLPDDSKVIDVCVMEHATTYITENNKFYSFGRNQYGQLGVGDGLRRDGTSPNRNVPIPVMIDNSLAKANTIEKMLCGDATVLVLADQNIYGWGRNDHFELGIGHQMNQYIPQMLYNGHYVNDLFFGKHESYAIDTNGTLYGWGRGWFGQMGNGETFNQVIPKPVTILSTTNLTNLIAGDGFIMGMYNGSEVFSLGFNEDGRLAVSETGESVFTPTPSNTTAVKNNRVVKIKNGGKSPILFANDGKVYRSGQNIANIFAIDNSELNSKIPFFVEGLKGVTEKISDVESSDEHSFYIEGYLCDSYLDNDPLVCSTHGRCTNYRDYCACELGYANANNRLECSICPIGTYSMTNNDFSETSCEQCPVATYNPTPGKATFSSCLDCPVGMITNGPGKSSLTDCEPCPQGTYATVDTLYNIGVCKLCPKGTFSDANAAASSETCKPCAVGTWNDQEGSISVDACIACLPGTYSTNSQATSISTCLECPVGTYSKQVGATSQSFCVDCPMGTYTNTTGTTTCASCPLGTVTASTGSTTINDCLPCSPGSFANHGVQRTSPTCETCPLGTYAPNSQTPECTSCPSGSITFNNGSTDISDCSPCPKGSYTILQDYCVNCSSGYYSSKIGANATSDCIPCRTGTWSDIVGATSIENCTLCSEGTFSIHLASNSISTCADCPDGTFSHAGSQNCISCPTGSHIIVVDNRTTCIPCQPGEYIFSFNGTTTCPKCPYGTYSLSDSAVACTKCNNGSITYQEGSNSSSLCIDCVPGTYAVYGDNFNECKKCPLGTYSETIGAHQPETCLACPSGTYNNVTGNDNPQCIQCPAGTFFGGTGAKDISECELCPPESYAYSGASNCTSCPSGTVTDGFGAKALNDCLPCFTGTYSQDVNGKAECIDCVPGTYSITPSATSPDVCIKCSTGTYSPVSGANNPSTCIDCPIGTFQPIEGARNTSNCLDCKEGTYSENTGMEICSKCPPGYSGPSSSTDTSNCYICPPGTYSNYANYTQLCLSCPKGTYSTASGAVDINTCISCPAGYYSEVVGATSSSFCVPCPKGTSSNFVGAPHSSFCKDCNETQYSDELGLTQCKDCIVGTIPEGTAKNSSDLCLTCGPGFYLYQFNNTHECKACPAGYYSETDNAISIQTCEPCPAGTWSSEVGRGSISDCNKCPTGTFSVTFPAKNFTACHNCPYREYNDELGQTECKLCPYGTVTCTGDLRDNVCVPRLGSKTIGSCIECLPGQYFDESLFTCVKCDNGYYSSYTDPNSNYCGYHTDSLSYGQEKCSRVTPHYQIGNASCIPCPEGTYFLEPSASVWRASSKEIYCSSCPASFYSNGTALTENLCKACPAGTWSTVGSPLCNKCPGGTFSNKPEGARTSPDDCVPCALGQYSIEGSSSCINCPLGSWSTTTQATSNSSCNLCRAGTYSDTPRATSISTCIECEVGFYAASEGSTRCLQCPAGTFQDSKGSSECITCSSGFYSYIGSSSCKPCVAGTYNPLPGGQSIESCIACKQGTFAPEVNSSFCIPCGQEFDCPFGSSVKIEQAAFVNYFENTIVNVTEFVSNIKIQEATGEQVKWSVIPIFCVIVVIGILGTIIFSCIKFGRRDPLNAFKNYDLLYNMDHPTLIGKPKIKRKNRIGGLLSVIAFTIVSILLAVQTSDVYFNNINIEESFQMVKPKGAEDTEDDVTLGKYSASVVFVGNYPSCTTDESVDNYILVSSNGFLSSTPNASLANCETRHRWFPKNANPINLTNCFCTWECVDCSLDGIEQSISFFARDQYAPLAYFNLSVPHYTRDKDTGDRNDYVIDGNVIAPDDEVFFGPKSSPISLFYTIFQSRYLSSPNVIESIFNSTPTEKLGLTSQLLAVSTVGASSSNDKISQVRSSNEEAGVGVQFTMDVSKFEFIVKEAPKQTATAFVAQVAALSGAIISVIRTFLIFFEKSNKVSKKMVGRIRKKLDNSPEEVAEPKESVDTRENVVPEKIEEIDPWHYFNEKGAQVMAAGSSTDEGNPASSSASALTSAHHSPRENHVDDTDSEKKPPISDGGLFTIPSAKASTKDDSPLGSLKAFTPKKPPKKEPDGLNPNAIKLEDNLMSSSAFASPFAGKNNEDFSEFSAKSVAMFNGIQGSDSDSEDDE
eukprot:CAMPEP_0117419634 /NCGR_PEP_ID=MMETSP0758-20121206/1153_1 /TAXON_ID=63605 /ORGANISM="Percolomonas cosmopolitus, Strain AE-1 (ATCC 50343)" /LENGTH=2167 /DNA_ID=CAMNT_0005200809 /DNA_START=260 /DNA_END=6763 /DNA_ORIENTATION=-